MNEDVLVLTVSYQICKKVVADRRLAGSTSTKAAFDAHITSFGDYQPGIARWAQILLYVSMLHNGRY